VVRARAFGSVKSVAGGGDAREPIDDASGDFLDVPAAVVCATCGDAECPGCAASADRSQASGILAIVPWERPGMGFFGRLWGTARVATTSADSFFGALPDGETAAALRFAVTAELCAVSGLVLVLGMVAGAIAPWVLQALWSDPAWRGAGLRGLAGGVPALALLMVGLHALHGIGLDFGARRAGGRRRGRGLRFGLYSCGWDLVALPLGALILALTDGLRAGARAIPLGLSVPSRAARAYLRGVHGLDDRAAAAAARVAMMLAGGVLLGMFGAALALILVHELAG
jgi:hypothetical protein